MSPAPWPDPPIDQNVPCPRGQTPVDSMTGGGQGRIDEQGRIDHITDAARDFALQLPWALLLVSVAVWVKFEQASGYSSSILFFFGLQFSVQNWGVGHNKPFTHQMGEHSSASVESDTSRLRPSHHGVYTVQTVNALTCRFVCVTSLSRIRPLYTQRDTKFIAVLGTHNRSYNAARPCPEATLCFTHHPFSGLSRTVVTLSLTVVNLVPTITTAETNLLIYAFARMSTRVWNDRWNEGTNRLHLHLVPSAATQFAIQARYVQHTQNTSGDIVLQNQNSIFNLEDPRVGLIKKGSESRILRCEQHHWTATPRAHHVYSNPSQRDQKPKISTAFLRSRLFSFSG